MGLLDIISILVVVANLALGFFVWWKGKKKKANIWFFLLTIAVAIWPIANCLSLQNFSNNIILFWMRVVMALAVIQSAAFLTFISTFIKLDFHKKNIRLINYFILFALTIYIVFSPFLFNDIKFENGQRLPVVAPGIIFFIIFTICSLMSGFILLIRKMRKSVGIVKMQIRYILFGAAVMFCLLLIFNFGFVVLFKNSSFISISPLFILPFTILTCYVILRYRLMDIKVVIQKSVVHFISIAIVLFLYLYLLFFTQKYLVDTYHWNSQSSIIVLVLVISLTIEPLRRFLFTVVDKVFYAKKRNAREETKKLRFILASSLQFDQLIAKVKVELQSFLEVQKIEFIWYNRQSGSLENYFQDEAHMHFGPTDPLFYYLQDHPGILVTEEIPYMLEEASGAEREVLQHIEQALKKLNVGLVYPLGERGELVGAFLFSSKSQKEAFTSDNVEYLSGLQMQLTGAIMNTLLYKQAVERITKLK